MSNSKRTMNFLELAASGKVAEAFDKYVSNNFIHHNQYFKGGRQDLIDAMIHDHETQPNKSIDIKKCIVQDDTVVTYSHVVKEQMEIVVVHIFRFENDMIAELWDVGQLIEKESPNQFGVF